MKRVLLIGALFYFMSWGNIYSQSINKGNSYIGVFGSWAIFDDYGFSGYFETRFEYLVTNRLSLGSDLGLSHTSIDFNVPWKFGSINIGVFTKYYFLNKKLSPIVEIKYLHGFTYEDSRNHENRRDQNTAYLNAGISTPRLIADRIGFDLTTGLLWTNVNNGPNLIRYSPLTSIRITYCIRRR